MRLVVICSTERKLDVSRWSGTTVDKVSARVAGLLLYNGSQVLNRYGRLGRTQL